MGTVDQRRDAAPRSAAPSRSWRDQVRRLLAAALALAPFTAPGWAAGLESCLSSGPVVPGDYDCSLRSGGLKRTLRMHIPPSYHEAVPTALVLAFHGGLGTGRYMQKQSRMDPVADQNGFIAVYPDGLYRTWNAGGCCEEAMRRNIDDVGFVVDLLAALSARLAIDRNRVYATGFSNGAMFAHRLACDLPDRLAAIAPVSGVIMVPECMSKRGLSVMVFHGTDDPRSLWKGGLGDKNAKKGTRESIPVTMDRLYQRYHCSGGPKVTFERGRVTCSTHTPCMDGSEVTLCRIEGGGHQWPGGAPVWADRLGPMNEDVSASELMWGFFERHPRKTTAAGP